MGTLVSVPFCRFENLIVYNKVELTIFLKGFERKTVDNLFLTTIKKETYKS
jgi:hypothetical protein